METPHKHHYSPAFYLKEWTGADSRLCEYSRLICACPKVNGRIRTRCTFPDGTGYEIDLYRVEGLPETEAHSVETVFMGMVDTDAKRALDKIISGDTTPWDSKMRSAWTRFILSLVFRNPEAVHLIETVMSEIWKTATADLQVDYEKLRQPTDPLTLEEFVVPSRAAPGKAALLMLQQIIDNDRLGPTIFDMHWVSVSVAEFSFSFSLPTGRSTCLTDWGTRRRHTSPCRWLPECFLSRPMTTHGLGVYRRPTHRRSLRS